MAVEADALHELRARDVHVWYVDLAIDAGTVVRLAVGLSESERARAGRFKLERDARRFVVSLGPGEAARFVDIGGDTAALARWTLHDLTPREGYAGALVVERAARAVVTRGWSVAEAAE
jgi:hypothetical protein